MKKNFLIILFLCLVTTFATATVPVNTADPMAMLKAISTNMLNALKKERPRLKRNPNLIYDLVHQYVVPYVDVVGMSRSVLGRNAWLNASPIERTAFSQAFTHVVIQTYASALNAYVDETIEFFPLRGEIKNRRRLQIFSKVIRHDGPPIPVSYRLALFNNTHWKIYDLNVEGVSLLQSFYAQFASELSQGKTIKMLTQELEQRKKHGK